MKENDIYKRAQYQQMSSDLRIGYSQDMFKYTVSYNEVLSRIA